LESAFLVRSYHLRPFICSLPLFTISHHVRSRWEASCVLWSNPVLRSSMLDASIPSMCGLCFSSRPPDAVV
jgi:hypothetical protein